MQDELTRRLARAGSRLDARFEQSDVERALLGFERKLVRRRRMQRASLATGLLALVALGFFAGRPAEPLAQGARRTRDGSVASPLEAATELHVQRDSEHEVALDLVRGAGHFAVSKRASRRYRVQTGAVAVEVLGTVFDVQRRGAQSRVSVQRGAVRVSWPGGQTILHDGESGWFPPLGQRDEAKMRMPEAAAVPVVVSDVVTHEADTAAHDAPSPARREAWRSLARAGKHGEAFRSLEKRAVDDLEGLLLAADAARLSGHPREAAQYLERLVRQFPRSAQARLATFTLGGLQLQELASPARAAQSFARAYALDPDGPLAEDALAREAEAYARAGDVERARRAAERYVKRYPTGSRRAELQRHLP